MRPNVPASLDAFHIINFLPLINPTYTPDKLSAKGLSQDEAVELGAIIMTFWGAIMGNNHNLLQDFKETLFGNSVYNICQIPIQPQVARLWHQNPKQLTHLWIQELVKLHSVFADYISTVPFVRASTHPEGFMTATEELTRKDVVLAPSAVVQNSFLSVDSTNTLYHQLNQFLNGLQEVWIIRAQRPTDTLW